MNTIDSLTDQTVLYQPENPLPDFTFSALSERLRSAVQRLGWTAPTPVQTKAIPYLLERRDMIVQARTGSGKTAAYMLPILETLRVDDRWCQALVLVPTRELARQVFEVFTQLSDGSGVTGALLYGGVGYGEQTQALRAGAHVVIGTPGRILDHVYRGTFSTQRVETLVLDEADEMLSMGFYPSMRKLRRQLPDARNTLLFSATIPYHVERLAHEFMRNPDRLSLSKGTQSVTELEHRYYIIPALQKERVLIRIVEYENPESGIIFCNTKRSVEYLAEVLRNHGYDALPLTGDLAQKRRERTLDLLRDGNLRFLIATDVAARGIDISDLSHVFLYDIPENTEVYVHRSGRTARAGKTGVAITLCESFEELKLLAIARQYKFDIEKWEPPTPEAVQERISERLTVQLETELNGLSISERDRITGMLPLVDRLVSNEDPRMLLALLLDRAYLQGLHVPLMSAPEPAAESPSQSGRQKRKRGERGERGEREERGERKERGERGERKERGERGEREERGERGEPKAQNGSADAAVDAEATGAVDVTGDAAGRKRKRNRNRKRGSGTQDGDPGAQTSESVSEVIVDEESTPGNGDTGGKRPERPAPLPVIDFEDLSAGYREDSEGTAS